jgi:hypothetical protein
MNVFSDSYVFLAVKFHCSSTLEFVFLGRRGTMVPHDEIIV